jgi:FkbM family methyltransferase
MALSDHNGIVNFQLPMLGEEVYGGFYQNGRFEALETVQVAARRLDDVLTVHSINDVKLIKLDAEGAELSILRGASRLLATHPVLIFEANEKNLKPFGYTVRDVIDFVSGYGYSLRQLDEENWIAE